MENERINIMTVKSSDLDKRFFIDCPVRTVMEGEKCIRMEIPQELAKYIFNLQELNMRLKAENKKLKNDQEYQDE